VRRGSPSSSRDVRRALVSPIPARTARRRRARSSKSGRVGRCSPRWPDRRGRCRPTRGAAHARLHPRLPLIVPIDSDNAPRVAVGGGYRWASIAVVSIEAHPSADVVEGPTRSSPSRCSGARRTVGSKANPRSRTRPVSAPIDGEVVCIAAIAHAVSSSLVRVARRSPNSRASIGRRALEASSDSATKRGSARADDARTRS